MFAYPGMEQERLYQSEYILLLEAGLNMMKQGCKNFIFTSLYEPYMPNRDANIEQHNKFKKIIVDLGFTYIEFNVRWRIQESKKWYKEQAILIGVPSTRYLTAHLGKKYDSTHDGIICVGKNIANKGNFLLKTADGEHAVIYCNGDIKSTELFTPDVIFNFYSTLRGQQVQFLSFGEDNCGREKRPYNWISAMCWYARGLPLMRKLAAGKALEELEV